MRRTGATALAGMLLAGVGFPAWGQETIRPAERPLLVTFGLRAAQTEGDHDYRQLIRFSVPADAGKLYVRVYDPDVGGVHDEPMAGFDTQTRFGLYGSGSEIEIFRDEEGVVQETVVGDAIGSVEFGADRETDARWISLFSIDPSEGAANGNTREFVLAVEGVAGNDGNVFDVAVSTQEDDNVPPDGLKIYSYIPTFQSPEENTFVELRFRIPDDATELEVENSDAAKGEITYGGRFRHCSYPWISSATPSAAKRLIRQARSLS